MTTVTPAVPRAASTVLIVRDGRGGIEIFMVARDRQVDMATGAVIFPGGKVDADDEASSWPLAAPASPERPFWIAAVRETFEETGLLLANAGRDPIAEGVATGLTSAHRTPLLDGAVTFSSLCRDNGLTPAFDRMAPFAHWITPVNQPKRFDTHFFLAAAPEGQTAEHDGQEAVSSFWMRPRDLLAEAAAGRQTLVPPTRLNLELLAETPSVAEAFAAARTRRIVTVLPEATRTPEGMRLTLPKDAGYKTTEILIKR